MENTGSDQLNPSLFGNHHASDEVCANGGLVLRQCVYRLSTNLGTVLHRKITMRHLTGSGLFK